LVSGGAPAAQERQDARAMLQPLQELAAGEHGRRQVRLHVHQ